MTRTRSLLQIGLVATTFLAVSVALSVEPSASPAAAANVAADIEQSMGQINRAVKVLAKGIDKTTEGEALQAFEEIEKAILDSKSATPKSADDVDEKKRDKFVDEYRVMMLELLKEVCDAEIAVVQGKYKNASKVVTKLEVLKSQGHGKFNPKGG